MVTALDSKQALDPRIASFLKSPKKMLIDGKWVASKSGKTFPTYNPATGEVLVEIAEGDKADVDAAVAAARRAFESGPWHSMTPSQRGKLMWKLADLLEKYTDEFAALETADNGKPFAVAKAADVPLAVDLLRYMAGWATKIEGNTLNISVPYAPGLKFHAYTLR
ncbi:MAG: aldehyde dehydrogenase family protein, partial [Verrucomicrobiae bacterium]|nr:aldehyde dehydrogenase family protein [Verrucomicrobiae bacterium]